MRRRDLTSTVVGGRRDAVIARVAADLERIASADEDAELPAVLAHYPFAEDLDFYEYAVIQSAVAGFEDAHAARPARRSALLAARAGAPRGAPRRRPRPGVRSCPPRCTAGAGGRPTASSRSRPLRGPVTHRRAPEFIEIHWQPRCFSR